MQQPSIASLGASVVGRTGLIRGGVEAYSLFSATGSNTSGYAGLVTFIGAGNDRAYGVAGVGIGSYVGGEHQGIYEALSGSTRLEVGVRVVRGWSVVARVDSLKNEISSSRIGSLGLSFHTR